MNARTPLIARARALDTNGGAQPDAPTSSAPARTAAESLSFAICSCTASIRAIGSGSCVGRSTSTVEKRLPPSSPARRTETGTSATGSTPGATTRSIPATAARIASLTVAPCGLATSLSAWSDAVCSA